MNEQVLAKGQTQQTTLNRNIPMPEKSNPPMPDVRVSSTVSNVSAGSVAEKVSGEVVTQSKHPFIDNYTKPVKKSPREMVGRELELSRLEACLNRPELCNAMLLAEAGTGKGFPDDTLIAVDDQRGYIRFGDLQIGDYVFDENGIPTQVIGVYPQGLKHAYKVIFTDGSSVICNDEHIWTVRMYYDHNRDRDNFYRDYTLKEIMDYGVTKTVTRKKNGVIKEQVAKCFYVPICKPLQRENHEFVIHPYLMGVFLGDGCMRERALTISSSDECLVSRVAELLGATNFYQSKYSYSWRFEDGNNVWKLDDSCHNRYIKTSDLADRVDYDCVFYCKFNEKRIPGEYFLGSEEQRWDLLRGLMDTDGTIQNTSRANCSYSTISENLAHDVMALATSLGIRTTLTFQDRRENDSIHKNIEYSVHFSISYDLKPKLFWLPRKVKIAEDYVKTYTDNVKFRKIYDDMSIDRIEDLGIDLEMTCIMVDSPDHLYVVGKEHIVTHNTMLVQGLMAKDKSRLYLEVNLAKMIADYDPITLGNSITALFSEVQTMREEIGKEVVLFVDEFHQLVQLSPPAVEAMKPLLADSGTRGIKFIAATTYIEFRQWIQPNQPLVERLQRINLSQPDKKMTVAILRGMAKQYGVENQFYNDSIYEMIYEITNRYMPSNSQPRKSILMLDAMVGWHRATGRPMDRKLLADVIYESEGINIAFRVDASSIKKDLDAHVYAQELASTLISNRLQIAVADLNDKSKPMASFLFTGSTGVGKGLTNYTKVPVYTPDGSVSWKFNGNLEIGDYVFNRKGEPVKVVGVFPRGKQDIYEVTLTDGRTIYTDSSHLWTYLCSKGKYTENTFTNSTKELYDRGVYIEAPDGRHKLKYFIPMNEPVQYPEADLSVHPYVMGAFIGDGCCTINQLTISSSDEEIVARISDLLGATEYCRSSSRSYNWTFGSNDIYNKCHKKMQTNIVFADYPEVCGKPANEKRIPDAYMYASVEQRWELVKGLFDTDGSIGAADGGRYNVSYFTTSKRLVEDIQNLLYSLGVSSTIRIARQAETGNGHYVQYRLNVKSSNENKDRFFWLPRKVEIANRAKVKASTEIKSHKKDYFWVGIADIKKLSEQAETTCIYVDDEEHLYQAGQYIVTHNTEMTKQLASILFGQDRDDGGDSNQSSNKNLIRFDMTEYANSDTLERFRRELTSKIWERPYSVLLLDEIEKACAEVVRLLLQVLDDGRLSDENNRQVPFTNCYIILTTNAGSEIYKTISQYSSSDTGDGSVLKRYNKLIRSSIAQTTGDNRFPPELLGRIDAIIPFQPLSENTMRKIVKTKLGKLVKDVNKKHGIDLRIDMRVVDYLVRDNLDTDSNSGGARIVVTKLTEEITTPVAKFINENPGVKLVGVQVAGEMAWEHKDMLESTAYIKVGAGI